MVLRGNQMDPQAEVGSQEDRPSGGTGPQKIELAREAVLWKGL